MKVPKWATSACQTHSLSDLVALLRESGLTVHLSTLKRHLGPVGDDREVYRRARAPDPAPVQPVRPQTGVALR